MADGEKSHGFWSSLPGVLTAVAAIITATAGLVVALKPSQSPQPSIEAPQQTQPVEVEGPKYEPAPPQRVDPPSIAVPPPKALMGPLEPGKNYEHSDLYSRPSGSAEDCLRLCREDDQCKAMTWIRSQELCWLKNSVPAAAPNGDMVSAVKLTR